MPQVVAVQPVADIVEQAAGTAVEFVVPVEVVDTVVLAGVVGQVENTACNLHSTTAHTAVCNLFDLRI